MATVNEKGTEMTNVDKAIELLMDALDDLNIRSEWPHAPGKINQALTLLREKPEPTDLSKHDLIEALRSIYDPKCECFACVVIGKAAKLLDQQARHIAIADEALKLKESLNGSLRLEIGRLNAKLKKERT